MNSISVSALSFSGTAHVSMPNRAASAATETDDQADEALGQDKPSDADDKATAGPTRADGTPLAPEEIQLLEQLKQTDRDVRQHEMTHQIAGGAYTGGASYEYEIGPDGKRYAVAGEVPIDYGPVPGDPQATIEKMQTVIAAAMAPADPSPKDLQIAAQARQYLLEAKLEAAQQQSMMAQARGSEPNDPETAETTLGQMA
ncbi:putative metalloprotease CJM1_0395 family protein [Vreelandella populi]|uniref:SprA-related family protein n=1 Tax=Vreelandella populi TaxID=2498858 RepID=A0A433L9Z1_9GAMM|nr:putative metalloprotease CJM1_0395 family protein [Halomonas populi]RUR41213.1 SprA-related family protein [Halomonas populi]RUR44382.1 SprA-related family protein [Halomonas populi]